MANMSTKSNTLCSFFDGSTMYLFVSKPKNLHHSSIIFNTWISTCLLVLQFLFINIQKFGLKFLFFKLWLNKVWIIRKITINLKNLQYSME
jgi:hypothetical protein